MCLIVEIIAFIYGIVVLITGKYKVSADRVAYGTPARIAGFMLMLPVPLALVQASILTLVLLLLGKQPDLSTIQRFTWVIEIVLILACVGASLAIAGRNSEPPRKRSASGMDDPDEEEYPRHGADSREMNERRAPQPPPDDHILE